MAILDANTQLATAYSPTTGTQQPAFYLDTLALGDWGMGQDWIWYVQIATTFTGGTSLQLTLQGNATDPTFASGNVTLRDTGAIAEASLLAGSELRLKIDRASIFNNAVLTTNNYRYIRLNAVSVGTHGAGVLNSWLTLDAVQDNRPYPSGYTVL
jgi:hypothetical protein